jgi:hypothetical protein
VINRNAILFVVFALITVLSGRARCAEGFESFSYGYGERQLFLKIRVPEAGTLEVRFRAVLEDGSLKGKVRQERFPVNLGENVLVLEPVPENAHRISMTLGAAKVEVYANRGTWYTAPAAKQVTLPHTRPELAPKGDVVATPTGFTAQVEASKTPGPITLGRSFAPDGGYGLALQRSHRALVFETRGAFGPVIVTLTERVDNTSLRYWDYPMSIDGKAQRYEIPFVKFTPRDAISAPIKTVFAVSFKTLNPAKPGERLTVSHLGVSPGGPFVASITRSGKSMAKVRVGGPRRAEGTLFYRDKDGKEASMSTRAPSITIPGEAERLWLCHRRAVASRSSGEAANLAVRVRVCDPPDAPLTYYGVASAGSASLVVDEFASSVPVNAFRIPVIIFGSSHEVEQAMSVERTDGNLRLTYYPKEAEDYAGYLSYLPGRFSDQYKTLSVSVRGSLPPKHMLAGIKDQDGREARMPFISYWRGDETSENPLYDLKGMNTEDITDKEGFKTVRFPLDGFRAAFHNVFAGHVELKDISAVSLTMTYGGLDVFHEMEVKRVAFTRDVVPITITAFDGDMYGINALGGVNFDESANGGQIDVRLNSAGYYGKGLRVAVTLPKTSSYGLVAMGFGRLDVTDYSALSFYVRGEHGDEIATVYLNDGKRRAQVPLGKYIQVTKMWRKVTIPLEDFEKQGVRLTRLTQLILAWEARYLKDQIMYFDNFVFE